MHYQAKGATTPLRVVDTNVEEHHRQALLKNGYADHFLQDSFAAGHLVNKTLVMQWFVDYLNGLNWLDRPWLGMPGDDVMKRMGSRQQPGVAGLDRYGRTPRAGAADDDRWLGTDAIDPQTAQERYAREGRVAGTDHSAGAGVPLSDACQSYCVERAGVGVLEEAEDCRLVEAYQAGDVANGQAHGRYLPAVDMDLPCLVARGLQLAGGVREQFAQFGARQALVGQGRRRAPAGSRLRSDSAQIRSS